MDCVECGQEIPPEVRDAGKIKSSVCSVACRIKRGRKTSKAWAERNRERVLAWHAEYRKTHKAENPDYFKEFYRRNQERRKAEARGWYSENVERQNETVKAYRAARPEWARDIGRKSAATRRARIADLFVEAVDHRIVFERDKGVCGICKTLIGASRWEIDHKVPIAAGGVHSYDNVQLAHRRCNRAKGAKVVPECTSSHSSTSASNVRSGRASMKQTIARGC